MFYSNYDNYMQDLYNYNQYPNSRYNTYNTYPTNSFTPVNQAMNNNGYNPYMSNINNNYMQSANMSPSTSIDYTNMYPSIYRILNPVVSKVVSGSNYQYLTEETLNNMVDTVYNITEGQVDLTDDTYTETSSENRTVGINASSQTKSTTSDRNTNPSTTGNTFSGNNLNYARKSKRANDLLKDLIRILVIREILSRRNSSSQQYSTTNSYPYNQFGYYPSVYA